MQKIITLGPETMQEECTCIYEVKGHREGEGECPYGPDATTPHPDGVTRYIETGEEKVSAR